MTARPRFWERKNLAEMNDAEWESLCDGCGKCCLHKLVDHKERLIDYTCVACKLLDEETARCRDYANRQSRVSDCIDLRREPLDKLYWLPSSCAYRLLSEGGSLPDWHPLITGDSRSTIRVGRSVVGKTVSEEFVPEEALEEYVVHWVNGK